MGDLLFEDAETARSYQDYRPNYSGLGIEKEVLSFMGQAYEQPGNVDTIALDIGCGTGQLTRALAPLFKKMIGIDRSKSQIDVAKGVTKEKNIEYLVNVAEDLSFLQDNSIDLISTAAAVHYFEPEPFLAEVDRVLKPGGCFLVLLFAVKGIFLTSATNNDDINNKCEDIMEDIRKTTYSVFKKGSNKVISSGSYSLPDYPDRHHFQLTSKRRYDHLDEFVGFLKSLGTLKLYNEQHPEEGDQIERIKKRLRLAVATSSSTQEISPVVLNCMFNCYMYRK
ncbi:uncharacterized protein [Apostichopus japonicus]|uniref:uncharacterized protein n=1 Tax=Stichopus japonicus TaxID=307972 RepID=UPI003AB2C045